MNNETEIIMYGLIALSLLCIIQTTIKLANENIYVRTHDTSSVEKLANKKPPKVKK